VRSKGGNPDLVGVEQVEIQEVNSDEDQDLMGWSADIRLADYKKAEKKKEREAAEERERQRQKDPLKAMEEDQAANRSFFHPDGAPRQCNDGRWKFRMDEDNSGNVVGCPHVLLATCTRQCAGCPGAGVLKDASCRRSAGSASSASSTPPCLTWTFSRPISVSL